MHKYATIHIVIILVIFLLVLTGIGLALYFTVFKSSKSISPSPVPSDWVMNLYKGLNWNNAPTSALSNSPSVSNAWINWAQTSPNSIMQYYVNYRRTTQKMMDPTKWPVTNNDIILNPIYSWDGLSTAIHIWNTAVQINSQTDKPDPLLSTGFCDETDEDLRKMTLAAFLANATVESAYFLVCKESTTLTDGTLCPGGNPGDPKYNPRYYNNCDQANPMNYSCQGGPPNPQINPVSQNCTGGWPTCYANSSNITTDPCMTYPNGLVESQPSLSNKATCSDWNNNPWQQQQECYFGRGLIQLTWSCNYFQVQNSFTRIKNIVQSSSDPILQQFVVAQQKAYNDPESVNICANPDKLCGNVKFDANYKVTDYGSLIDQAMPWLTCIIYWCTKIPTWKTCYSFATSYQGIAPSGAGNYPDRLNAYKFMLNLMNVTPGKYKVTSDGQGNVCLNTTACANCGGSTSAKNYCGVSWDKPDCTKECQSPEDCLSGQNCYANTSCPADT